MDSNSQIACVILAGGAGKRMGSTGKHKVCFPIAGRPAIVRAIDTYKAAGLKRFLVVVGQMAEQVVNTVAEAHPEVSFVFQTHPRGTGHAAAVAVDALAAQAYRGGVVITMGDKVPQAHTVRELLERYHDGSAGVVMSTMAKAPETTAGRVVADSRGRVLGIVELADIKQGIKTGQKISVGGRKFGAASLEKRAKTVNVSMYAFRFAMLQRALRELGSDNAQGEMYLTDTIEIIASRGRVDNMPIADPTDLMAFNTPAELVAIEEVISQRETPPRVSMAPRRRLSAGKLKTAAQWMNIFDRNTPALQRALRRIYGSDQSLVDERRKAMNRLAAAFLKRHGADRPMIICRAPGRLNLMGRHVDHRGGYVNVIALSRETLLAAAPREDDVVDLRNSDSAAFPPRKFRIYDLLRDAGWSDWLDFLTSQTAAQVIQTARGDWSHYARAPLLRLQHEVRSVKLKGMDCLVSGNIPTGAGLSSSSALVVGFAEAAVALNRLDVAMQDFVDLCGEGEWFVGSRGGSADHAAIRTSKRGHVSRIGFFPFHAAGQVRFPSRLSIVIADSGVKAVKSASARDTFNQRVACSELSQLLLRRRWPPAAGLEHLRDMSPSRLKVDAAEIYRALISLPDMPSRKQLRAAIHADDRARAEEIFNTHDDVGPYDLRGATMFGISECLRSESYAEYLRCGDVDEIGRMMQLSHDGDRVVHFDDAGRAIKHIVPMDDATLRTLASQRADLLSQTGRYACSTEEIDYMVQLATSCEGVIGAQLAGAGLGGCIMIVVKTDSLQKLMRKLRKEYYGPRGVSPAAHACTPVGGAGLLSIAD